MIAGFFKIHRYVRGWHRLVEVCDHLIKLAFIYIYFLLSAIDYYLLGDSAYGCTQYLLTPYKNNGRLSRDQIHFNIKLSSGRVAIEHTFGILKQRFRQLYYCKLRGNIKLCHFIRSCCVLHNLANEDDLQFSTSEVEDDDIPHNEQYGETSKGNAVRNAICNEILKKRN